ncbi:gamma subclass chorismate mutase AroQ [Nocardia terpenica]|uniref:gamma subclass chorismate mutase AroQ n=1 Tax=Nocardia terpenica TaxID=455432 RepID=UPI001895A4BE|nr:gamma subclass chorismate mutase AroQ [Nocardia terpenica]MBF6066008.1 gamma subclass chorismate mutase AroQ [Nocardia terpenica]MBF6109065.1 gamma subclass chorismate mutase AroQ [Nocardia terpenica]MBF6116252.1 gamma subclass chorismate mutase AroQ [Nocardia terpenica]MBF6123253.1 gamma subclass chorismate mutase AroQ [Nocardia terpenica]MBF6156564.1 gamma subclass chorismate mutase AroQ [Nocardia terpenica]
MRISALVAAVAIACGTTVAVLAPTVDRTAVAHAEAWNGLDGLVGLVLERLNTADAVIAAKWAAAGGHDPVVDDPAREAQVYDSMAREGAGLGLPEPWVRQVFFGQIEANKMVQRGLIARWRFDPSAAPASPPDLAAVRPIIDRVNDEILRQLADHRADLTDTRCPERLAASVFPVFTDGRADPLHEAALVRAVSALCPTP